MKPIGAIIVLLISLGYILNPGIGILEALPDNLPLIGNLDEATATGLFLWAIKYLRDHYQAQKHLEDKKDN